MLDQKDDYCKIIDGSLNTLLLVNIDKPIAEKLLKEPCLEVRKYASDKKMMEGCAVVKASDGIMYNIPRKILIATVKKLKNDSDTINRRIGLFSVVFGAFVLFNS